MSSFTVVSRGAEQTARIASVLAPRLTGGDAVLLTGDLAAGKTTFVKATVAALGADDVVTSPTFTLAQFYSSGRVPVLHIDTYRLADLVEYRDLGLDEHYERCVSLIEWGDLVIDEFGCRLAVRLDRSDAADETAEEQDVRAVTFSSDCDRWTAVMSDLHAELLEKAA